MKQIAYLVKRNILIYTRDKTAVFFSLLSMIIVIGLMTIFLGNMNSENIVSLLNQYGGPRDATQDKINADYLVRMWTIAGILVVNAVTVTLTMVGIMVQDEAQDRLSSFYVAPIKRMKLILGYIVSAIIVGFIMCCLTLILAEAYIYLTGGALLTIDKILKLLFMIIVNVFTFACIMFFIANFVHSESAFSGLSTIIGTLVGFIGGIYLPMGMLPESVQNILKFLPVLHGASMMRKVCVQSALATTFEGMPSQFIEEYQKIMGINIEVNDRIISVPFQMLFVVLFGIVAIAISTFIIKKRHIKNR